MSLTERLAYVLSADVTGADVGFKRVSVSAEQAALSEAKVTIAADKLAVAQARAGVAEAKAAGDADKLAAAHAKLAAAQGKLATSKANQELLGTTHGLQLAQKEAAGATQSLTGMSAAMEKLGKVGQAGGPGIGTVVAGAAAFDALQVKVVETLVSKFAEATGEVRAFQRVSGATAEDSSKLVYAMRALGVDGDAAGKAVFKLAREAESGGGQLSTLGVQIAKNADGSVDLADTVLNVADAVHAAGAGAQADAIAFAAFGRQGAALLPILLRGRDGLKELYDEAARHHQVFNDQDLQDGKEFNLAVKSLQEALTGLEIEGGKALIPWITASAKAAEKTITWVDTLTQAEKVVGGLRKISDWLGISAKKHEDLAAAAKEATDKDLAFAEAEDKAAAALQKGISAAEGLVRSDEQVADAKDAVDAAQRKVNDASKDGIRHARDLADANRQLADANRSVADAQDKLNEAQRQAPRHLEEAQLDAKDAAYALTDAQTALTVATEKYGNTSIEAAKAGDGVERAHLRQADAQDKLNGLQKAGTKPPDVIAAEKNVADAKQRAADAQQHYNDVAAEDPTEKMAQARRDLERAERGYRDALVADQDQRKKLQEDLDKGTVSADQLGRNLNEIIDQLKAAGTDPAVLAGLQNLAGLIGDQALTQQPQTDFRAGERAEENKTSTNGFKSVLQAPQTIVQIYAQTNASAKDIGEETAWAIRTRF